MILAVVARLPVGGLPTTNTYNAGRADQHQVLNMLRVPQSIRCSQVATYAKRTSKASART